MRTAVFPAGTGLLVPEGIGGFTADGHRPGRGRFKRRHGQSTDRWAASGPFRAFSGNGVNRPGESTEEQALYRGPRNTQSREAGMRGRADKAEGGTGDGVQGERPTGVADVVGTPVAEPKLHREPGRRDELARDVAGIAVHGDLKVQFQARRAESEQPRPSPRSGARTGGRVSGGVGDQVGEYRVGAARPVGGPGRGQNVLWGTLLAAAGP